MGRLFKRDFQVPIYYVVFQHPVAILDITRNTVLYATAQKIDQITAKSMLQCIFTCLGHTGASSGMYYHAIERLQTGLDCHRHRQSQAQGQNNLRQAVYSPSVAAGPLQVKVTLRLTVSQSVCLGVESRLGIMTTCFLLFQIYCPVHVGRPL
jgi:hypothetical protein